MACALDKACPQALLDMWLAISFVCGLQLLHSAVFNPFCNLAFCGLNYFSKTNDIGNMSQIFAQAYFH